MALAAPGCRRGTVATNVPSLEPYLTDWLAEVVAPNLAPATLVNYRLICRHYIGPTIGAKRLDKLERP